MNTAPHSHWSPNLSDTSFAQGSDIPLQVIAKSTSRLSAQARSSIDVLRPLPFVIAYILGGRLEESARQAFSATGSDPWFLFSSKTSAGSPEAYKFWINSRYLPRSTLQAARRYS